METWVSILLKALLAIIPACMADKRGRSAGGYYLFGLFCPLLVPIIVLSSLGPVDSLKIQNTKPVTNGNMSSGNDNVTVKNNESSHLIPEETSTPSFADDTVTYDTSAEYNVSMEQKFSAIAEAERSADGMITCPYCGQQIPATDRFCTFCGANMRE